MVNLIPGSKYCRWTLGLVIAQAVIVIALEAYCASAFLPYVNFFEGTPLKGIPVYLMIFLFSQVFQIFLCWDALLHQNTIQVIGFLLLNYCTFAYSVFQNIQLQDASGNIEIYPELSNLNIRWSIIAPCLIAVAVVLGLMSLIFTWIGFKLYLEFGWKIYKKIGADPKMKKMFRAYQVFVLMLKLDFFFFLGFTVQFLVLVLDTSDAEFALTIAAIPVVLIVLLMAVYAVRRESRSAMFSFIFGCLLAMGYFIFKLVRMYQPDREIKYRDTRKFLTFFAALSLLVVFLTLINSIVCLLNFDKGLKQHIQANNSNLSSSNRNTQQQQPGDVKLSGIEVELESADWNSSSALATIDFVTPQLLQGDESTWPIEVRVVLVDHSNADLTEAAGTSEVHCQRFRSPIAEFRLGASVTAIKLWLIRTINHNTAAVVNRSKLSADSVRIASMLDKVQFRLFIQPGNQTLETANAARLDNIKPDPMGNQLAAQSPHSTDDRISTMQKRSVFIQNTSQSMACAQPTASVLSSFCVNRIKYPISSNLTNSEQVNATRDVIQQYWFAFTSQMDAFDCRSSNAVESYSPVRDCTDCLDAYRDWLCGLYYPRCFQDASFEYRNPCSLMLCYNVVQSCPSFGFQCSAVPSNDGALLMRRLSTDYCLGRNKTLLTSAGSRRLSNCNHNSIIVSLLIIILIILK